MSEYRTLVETVMRDALLGADAAPRVFENIGVEHARDVLETMLTNAQERIDIYSEVLPSIVYDPKLIRAFLKNSPGGTVRVLIEAPDVFRRTDSALRDLVELIDGRRLIVHQFNGPAPGRHLAIVDKVHARIERSHDNCEAVVAFGNAAIGDAALKNFASNWLTSVPAKVPQLA
jgi:hypothetical protein